ncbi:MAG: hypothetical protein A3F43_03370 [Gammaproteobacteria bacterium RIFCSPHIGHO2_12_FULL_42_10]|nr:MAG: hypothetical protein A3F43_03370 [Gammaproteobacteria bacterium RIFCSPHIGHO2_12_FULL_42_10]
MLRHFRPGGFKTKHDILNIVLLYLYYLKMRLKIIYDFWEKVRRKCISWIALSLSESTTVYEERMASWMETLT